MAGKILQSLWGCVFGLAGRQHGVVSRAQLLEMGFSRSAVQRALVDARLHRHRFGVYVVGRPQLDRLGELQAALLASGPQAALSHSSAAELWGLAKATIPLEVSVPVRLVRSHPGLVVHRRVSRVMEDCRTRHGMRVTSPACTLVDLAARCGDLEVERLIDSADRLDLTDPERLRRSLFEFEGIPGARRLMRVVGRHSLVLTDSELERMFVPIALAAGIGQPRTQEWVNGYRVDFFWPDLGLVVETDGLRYHRTPAQQARDRERDQAHTAAGLVTLRFTHAQVRYEPDRVEATLRAVATRRRPSG